MRKTTQLKELILDPQVLIMPGAYDALSARLIEKAGFSALQCTGYGIAATRLGLPDIGILSMGEMLDQTRQICQAVEIPVMADGDTGFGGVLNVYNAVQRFEQAGAAGINLEDQVFPKRCGHLSGKQVIPAEEMVCKIRAARAAAGDSDFVINARTDAIAVCGVDEAIRRGNLYAQAGADLIFVEAPACEEDIRRVVEEINAPVSINMTEGGKTPMIPFATLQQWGVARISIPVTPLFAACRGMEQALEILREEGIVPSCNHPDLVAGFGAFTELMGLERLQQLEQSFVYGSGN